MPETVLSDAIKAMVGMRTDWQEAPHVVEASEVRRFHQATLDPSPRYFSVPAWLVEPVAPPAFVVEMFRRSEDSNDPLARFAEDRNYDGASSHFRGLPEIITPLKRLLNGGYRYQFYRYAKIGERIERRSSFHDIVEKQGSSGPMLIITIATLYRTVEKARLLASHSVLIQR